MVALCGKTTSLVLGPTATIPLRRLLLTIPVNCL